MRCEGFWWHSLGLAKGRSKLEEELLDSKEVPVCVCSCCASVHAFYRLMFSLMVSLVLLFGPVLQR